MGKTGLSYRAKIYGGPCIALHPIDTIAFIHRLQCLLGGVFTDSPNWPTCKVENCTQLLVKEGYKNASAVPVAIGQKVKYACEGENRVTDLGWTFELTCGENGFLQEPTEWPECRDAAICTNIPEPPESHNLIKTEATSALEFLTASYPCKSDGKFDGDQNEFKLVCPLGGEFPAADEINWPLCNVSVNGHSLLLKIVHCKCNFRISIFCEQHILTEFTEAILLRLHKNFCNHHFMLQSKICYELSIGQKTMGSIHFISALLLKKLC